MKQTNGILTLMLTLAVSVNAYSSSKTDPAAGKLFDLNNVKSHCININGVDVHDKANYSDCKVSEFGTFGTLNDKTYYYAMYCLLPHYEGEEEGKCDLAQPESITPRAISIFTSTAKDKQVQLLLGHTAAGDTGQDSYEKPEIINSKFGKILYVPIHLDGTGNFNQSIYMLMNKKTNQWSALDAESWIDKLTLPKGLTINKGVWPDLKSMSADLYLYKGSDANCCPTGGTLHTKLAIKHGKLTAESVVFNAAEVAN